MLELICQQRYRVAGLPVDISPYRNHGQGFDTAPAPGPVPANGAITFPRPTSLVAIPLGSYGAWSPLTALKIELDLNVDPAAALTQILVVGDGSFQFYLNQHAPAAAVVRPDGSQDYVRAADNFSPDGQFHPVPANRWVTLGFEHDGYANMRLLIDGVIVGQIIVNTGVPGVQSGGVTVGNVADGGRPVHGSIEELRVWRLDPRAMQLQFLSRPYSAQTAQCWEDAVLALGQWLSDNPRTATLILGLVQGLIRRFLHAALLLPQADQDQLGQFAQQYDALWHQGQLGGAKMAAVFAGFIGLLRAFNLDFETDPDWVELKGLLQQVRSEVPELALDCDPTIKSLSRAIRLGGREAH